MVRTQSALLAAFASGKLRNDLCFSNWRGKPYIRSKPTRRAPWSQTQLAYRTWMAWLCRAWAPLSAADKLTWTQAGLDWNLPGYQFFLRYNSERWAHLKGPSKTYPATEAPPNANYNTYSTEVGRRYCAILLNPGATVGRWYLALYRKIGGVYAHNPTLLVAAANGIPSTAIRLQDNTPIPGVTYRYTFSVTNSTGQTFLAPNYPTLKADP